MHPQPVFDRKHRVWSLAQRQFGLITTGQLMSCGVSRSQVETLARRGEIERVRRGVYRFRVVPASWHQQLLGACLDRSGVCASHRAAASLLGLISMRDPVVEVSSTSDIHRAPGVIAHKTRSLLPCDRTVVRGIPSTEVVRTLIDLGDVLSEDELEEALDRALAKRLTSLPRIDWRLRRMPEKGHRGSASLRRLVTRRRNEDAACESVLETKVLHLLRDAGLPPPHRQYVVRLPDGRKFRADFAYPEMKLMIEAQGYRWQAGRARWRQDLLRSSEFALLGFRVIYVSWEDVTSKRKQALERLRRIANPQLFD